MFTLNCRGRLLVVDKPLVMGIINATPDSFYAGSRETGTAAMVKKAAEMLEQGADILDIGGESTRPGSAAVSAEAELERVIDGIKAIHQHFPDAYISIDTYHALVAKEAVEAGACMVNDISAGQLDPAMIPMVASLQVPYILMHMKGTPATMQQLATYEDVTKEVFDFLVTRAGELRQAGIRDIIIDPGFGFAKTIEHNFSLLNNLQLFQLTDYPVLLGISRKATVYKTLVTTAEEALNGTTVLNTIGLIKGASILRVHDVKEAKEAITLVNACVGKN